MTDTPESTIEVDNIFPKMLQLGATQYGHVPDVITLKTNITIL